MCVEFDSKLDVCVSAKLWHDFGSEIAVFFDKNCGPRG